MTNKYQKAFPLSGPLTTLGKVDGALERLHNEIGTGTGTGGTNEIESYSEFSKNVKNMDEETALALTDKIAYNKNAIATLVRVLSSDTTFTNEMFGLISQFTTSTTFKTFLNDFIKQYLEDNPVSGGKQDSEPQTPSE